MLRSFIRDIIVLYLGYRLLKVWRGDEFTTGIGVLTIIVMLLTVWFLIEKIGVLPKIG